jgi:sugar lactone lactonase YvrE
MGLSAPKLALALLLTAPLNAFAWDCRSVPGVVGPEDVVIDRDEGLAYVSSFDKRHLKLQGALYVYDLDASDPRAERVETNYPDSFHPLGASLFKGDGRTTLFVVNRLSEKASRIERFDVAGRRLRYLGPATAAPLRNVNEVWALDDGRFLATRDHNAPTLAASLLSDLFRIRGGSVIEGDADGFRERARGIGYANGLALSEDGRTAFVSATIESALHVYDVDEAGAWHRRRKIRLPGLPDNIDRSPDGSLVVALHKNMWAYGAHAVSARMLSPGRVVEIRDPAGPSPRVKTILDLPGKVLSGSSSAALRGDDLLVGSVFSDLLHCRR